ncbi:hypothetical protein Cgig2_031930 [Carnegiea gigantea]|uniref:Uncharacterized protein n=1 Tax=Carnegiea gigantea TaxID=171969 RepID=A0A9Q1GTA9_9CARY|nr:hypothetical protein Cgig2_031930 [Carnegiea gigantea]
MAICSQGTRVMKNHIVNLCREFDVRYKIIFRMRRLEVQSKRYSSDLEKNNWKSSSKSEMFKYKYTDFPALSNFVANTPDTVGVENCGRQGECKIKSDDGIARRGRASCPLWLTPLHARPLSKSRELWRRQHARPGLLLPSSTRWSMKGSPLTGWKGFRPPRPMERCREVSRPDRSGGLPTGQLRRRATMEPNGQPAPPLPRDEECSIEVVATIAEGYAEGITLSAWKAQLRSAQQGHGPPRWPARAHPQSEVGLEITIILKLASKGQHDLVEVPEGVGVALLVVLLLGLDRISRGLLQLALQPFLLGLTGLQVRLQSFAMPLVPRDEPLQPPVLHDSLHPSSQDLSHGYFFLDHLGGIRSPRGCQVPGLNYVLDERELNGRVRLDEGRGALAWPGYVPPMTGSPISEGSTSRLSPPPLAMGRMPRPHLAVPRSSTSFEPPFRFTTDLPGPNDASKEEELVDALSEEGLLEECLEEEPDEHEEALELVEATLASGK